ncbi:hypothetical protein [Falsiroseomonas stagni]|uniref:Tetratricopeptide repeat-containing protein n=1 Tax=Falsiroseomonas stagni DSM 19981 TaxID=1123062 RepID=A0A1I4A127_9PROT|nr:hypothetical protein [Falsiroseomonas stagni]SFK50045.1 hypothetical protein SAMN02745775_10354 [Falsiroseomonas stagni DSM 19981]
MPARLPILLAFLLLLPTPSPAQEGTGAAVTAGRPAPPALPHAPSLAESIDDPATLLRLAGQILGAGRGGEALDLLERAEARLLTRSELASRADRPRQGGAVGQIAAARAALGGRDRPAAIAHIDQALAWLEGEPVPAPLPEVPAFSTPNAVGPIPLAQRPVPLPGIAPQDMPVGGTASPPVPIGPDAEYPRAPAGPGDIPPSSSKTPG